MKKVTAILEKGKDGYGVSFAEFANVYSFGETLEQAKQNAVEVLETFIGYAAQLGKPVPSALRGEYELKFEFDVSTLLEFAERTVTLQALARASKINPGQLSHYKKGVKPRPAQRQKIVDGLHRIQF